MSELTIFDVDRLDLRFTPRPWPFADERRAEIDVFFAARRRENPALWNGRVLLMHRHALSDGVLQGDYLETDYASFLAWRRWAAPDTGVHDCFGAAALISADGAVLLGRMGAHTANAGHVRAPDAPAKPGTSIFLPARPIQAISSMARSTSLSASRVNSRRRRVSKCPSSPLRRAGPWSPTGS